MPRTASLTADLFQEPLFCLFAQQRPVATLAQLALRHLLDPQALQQVFAEHACSQREQVIPFAALTSLLASVVLCQEPTVHAAFKKQLGHLDVSHQAVYGKLQRVEASTLRGLVQYSHARLQAAQRQLTTLSPHPDSLDLNRWADYDLRILDGNHLAATEHRLKETRRSTAAPLPGKMLVVYDPRHDAIVDGFPILDGHAQERSALDAVLATVQARQLWVADRNFCTLAFLYGVVRRHAHFVIRQHGQLQGQPLGQPRRIGRTPTGVVFEQRFLLPAHEGEEEGLEIRRVIVRLQQPTRDGEQTLELLTNLPEAVSALDIAELYRKRWRIETVMQHLTTTLRCEIKPLCYPQAALFGFTLALVLYNALALMLSAMEAAHGPDTRETLSRYYLALEIVQSTDGLLVAVPQRCWQMATQLSETAWARLLMRVAQDVDLKYFRKSTRGPKKPMPQRKHDRRKVHVSTFRLLEKRGEMGC